MGPLQTYFYLALLGMVFFVMAVLFAWVAVRSLRRWARQRSPEPTVFWLIGAAIAVAVLIVVIGTAGILYGFATYGGTGS